MAEERESELLWPSNNKEGEEEDRKRDGGGKLASHGNSRHCLTLLSFSSPLLLGLVAGGRFKKSSNHLPFSISLLPRGERRLLGAIRLSDRTVPDSEPDPGIRAPLLHWTRAEMHAGKELVYVEC